MVNLKIDGIDVCVPEGTTIMKAAASVGIMIPHLCYLEGINEIGACRVCVVEILGRIKLVTACNSPVEEGMVIFTNSKKVRSVRRTNVELILSEHDCRCATCVRSGNCNLQKLSNDLGILDIPFDRHLEKTEWDPNYPFVRDSKKCIKCMRCIQVCDKIQAMKIWDVQNTGSRTTVDVSGNRSILESSCTNCGQCVTHCPTGALRERNDLPKVYEALSNDKVITVVQVAPAVRAAWGEEFGLGEKATEKLMVAALKRVGFDYVFDTNFAADLTIMEEGNEFLKRLPEIRESGIPMFTSCCPGWVSFMKSQYPEYVGRLSSAKSPQQMFGAVTKSYFAKKLSVAPEEICCISIMPCIAKKKEAETVGVSEDGTTRDVDIVLTTREFCRLLKSEHIIPELLEEENFDSPLGTGSGAAVIFGAQGGVMEAALRTAAAVVEGKNPDIIRFSEVRSSERRCEKSFEIGSEVIKTCVVSGLKNVRELMEDIKRGRVHYDFVEVMACPGGCVGGGGQPIRDGEELAASRSPKLYSLDENNDLRLSHENAQVQSLYDEFLEHPLSDKAKELLHVNHCIKNLS